MEKKGSARRVDWNDDVEVCGLFGFLSFFNRKERKGILWDIVCKVAKHLPFGKIENGRRGEHENYYPVFYSLATKLKIKTTLSFFPLGRRKMGGR